MQNTILIVGAGFCGTVLAANLLRHPPSAATDIVLIERDSAMGRGVAHAVREFPYLLNVPAARCTADRVSLALRNPLLLLPWAAAIRDHRAYRHDPGDLPKTLNAVHSVLIVGNG